jgi:hypothetical protein
MGRAQKWNHETIAPLVADCKKRSDLFTKNPSAYMAARKLNLLDVFFPKYGVYNPENYVSVQSVEANLDLCETMLEQKESEAYLFEKEAMTLALNTSGFYTQSLIQMVLERAESKEAFLKQRLMTEFNLKAA